MSNSFGFGGHNATLIASEFAVACCRIPLFLFAPLGNMVFGAEEQLFVGSAEPRPPAKGLIRVPRL
jgi:hypothetical protein